MILRTGHWATEAVMGLDEEGRVVMIDNPSEAASWLIEHEQHSSQASAHLLSHLGFRETGEVFKKKHRQTLS